MISFFARNGVAANLLLAAIAIAGIYTLAMGKIPVEVFPEFESDNVHVRVTYRGATPEEVEESIVVKIEEAIVDVQGIERIVSTAREGSGSVSAEVHEDYDRRDVLDDIKSRVDAINTFPEDAERAVVYLSDQFRSVISVVLHGDLSERDLRELGEQVRDEIAALPDISDADLQGVRPYEIGIEIDEHALQQHNLSFDSISRALRSSSVDVPAGSLRTPSGDVVLRTKGRAYTGDEFANITIVTRDDGTRITLGEVADISDDFHENPFVARFNGERCVLITVTRQGNQSAIKIAEQVKDYMEKARERLPPGVGIDYWGDLSRIVRDRLDTLISSGWKSMLLVFGVLALFLRPSLAFWVVIGIPVCFLGCFAVMPYVGVTINIASLFGFILVLGVVVDDAIVTGENIYAHQRKGKPSVAASIDGTKEVAVPVTFGILTTVLAFVPLLLGVGFSMNYASHIALVVIPVLLFSLVESKLILPSHLTHCHFERDKKNRFSELQRKFADGLVKFINVVYQPFLGRCLKHRYLVLAIFISALAILFGIINGGYIQTVRFPKVNSERASARLTMQEGTPFEVTKGHIDRMLTVVEEMKNEYVGPDGISIIEDHISSVGGQGVSSNRQRGTQGEPHLGEVTFYIVEPENRKIKMETPEIVQEWRRRIGPIVGAQELYFRAEIGRGGDPIDVQLTSNNIDDLVDASAKVKEHLATYPDLFDISDNLDNTHDEIQLSIKPEAEQFGLTMSDLAEQVRQAFYGEEVQRVQRGRHDIRVMLRFPKEDRESLAALESMRIRAPDGEEVPFASVAQATLGKSFPRITRIDRKRALNITADADKTNANIDFIRDSIAVYLDDLIQKYPGMSYTYEGEAREQRESASAMWLGWGIIIFGIYSMLAIPFRSYGQPLIVMLVIPFGLIGAVIGHIIHGLPLSFLSYFGMLALSGVVVNDSLVLVDYINRRIREGTPLIDAVSKAGAARFRPIILTSLTTFAGLFPLITMQSTQSQFLIPMAVSLGYGILFATVITLILVPVTYLTFEDIRRALTGADRSDAAPSPPVPAKS
ncbi:MAG: efflux RND transporter permease subunit [Verrucomicrobiota bacterium]